MKNKTFNMCHFNKCTELFMMFKDMEVIIVLILLSVNDTQIIQTHILWQTVRK